MRSRHTLFVQLSVMLLMFAAGVGAATEQDAETKVSPELIVDVGINDEVRPTPSSWAAREYQAACKGKTRLYLFSEWLPGAPSGLAKRLRFWSDVTCTNRFDGIDVHEALNLEGHPDNMAELGKMAERLKTCAPE